MIQLPKYPKHNKTSRVHYQHHSQLGPRSLLICALLAILCVGISKIESSCDNVFLSTGESQVGKFEAPSRTSAKPFKIFSNKNGTMSISTNNTQDDYKTMHCVYKFIAKEGERVVLNFTSFRLRGDEPDCTREYVDIFVKFKQDDSLDELIVKEPPNGRFCTTVMPRKIVSLNNMLVLIFYSELKPPVKGKPMFTGTFQYIASKSHDQIGPPLDGTLC